MPNYFYRTYKYIQRRFSARHSYGFGVHSPYIFHFTKYVVYEKHPFYVFQTIESLRDSLLKRRDVVYVHDFGTGKSGERRVGCMARSSLKDAKYGQLLYRIARFGKCETILELGTSLGVTTAYLASADKRARCITMEGAPGIAELAKENFEKLQLDNVELVVGNIDDKLAEVLAGVDKLDLVFIDANHRSEAVLAYFDQCLEKLHGGSIVVVDDIYWSADMEQAWTQMKNHERVTSSIDLCQVGILFFNTDLHRKNYRMRI